VDVLYTDFSKAFDKVSHGYLIEKLRAFNLPINLLTWIKSYLSNRSQFVKYGSSESGDFNVTSGVPQGSHIGPTLFLLFINDIVNGMDDVFISLYADDVKIAKVIKTNRDAEIMQQAIDKLKAWCDSNHLHLNLDKCSVLTINRGRNFIGTAYTYGDHVFNRVTEYKDLGVIIDGKLLFSKHIEAITSKATAALGFIKRFCYDITDTQTLKTLYYSLVQSHLEYCSVVWLPFYEIHKNRIESILKQFSMFVLKEYPSAANNYKITPYSQRLGKLNMTSLNRRRINASILFMYDVLNGLSNCPTIADDLITNANNRNLRRNEFIKINDKSMKLAITSPVPLMCKQSNLVPELFSNSTSRTNFITLVRNISDNVFSI
jgi:ribonuclease P/MRP protein subunit RPP40